jgi:hypothetical protein
MATGVLFGVAPALQSTRPNVAPTLKDQATNVLGGQGRLRKVLVASQIAVSLLLLIGATLFLRTLDNLLAVDIGFETSHPSFTRSVLNGYDPPVRQFANPLEWLNGAWVEGAGRRGDSRGEPVEHQHERRGYQMCQTGQTQASQHQPGTCPWESRFSRPRSRTRRGDGGALVGSRLPRHRQRASRGFGDSNAVGGGSARGRSNTPTPIRCRRRAEFGIRDRTKRSGRRSSTSKPGRMRTSMRTSRPAESMFTLVRQTVTGLDANIPVHGTRTLERQVALSLSRERLVATMTATFGALATLLAVVGLYGVMSYTVARRTREIGVRVALGATAGTISWLVIREVLVIAAAGIAAALPRRGGCPVRLGTAVRRDARRSVDDRRRSPCS